MTRWSDVFDYDYCGRHNKFHPPKRLRFVEGSWNMWQYSRLTAYWRWTQAELTRRDEDKALQFTESFSQEVDE